MCSLSTNIDKDSKPIYREPSNEARQLAPGWYEYRPLAVLPEFQGTGVIAKMISDTILSELKRRSAIGVVALVSCDNISVIRFHKFFGFKEVSQESNYVRLEYLF